MTLSSESREVMSGRALFSGRLRCSDEVSIVRLLGGDGG